MGLVLLGAVQSLSGCAWEIFVSRHLPRELAGRPDRAAGICVGGGVAWLFSLVRSSNAPTGSNGICVLSSLLMAALGGC